jgi:4-hydroxybenzoyl-CoA reductase subunit alpha
LSRKAGRPVKLRADGDEEFTIYPAAGEGNFYFRTAVDADGRIRGLEIDMLTECGAHAGIQSAMHHMSSNYVNWLYKVEGVRFRSRAILTNSPPYFCHHGGPMAPMSAGWMQHLTRVAEQLGIDPIDFHIRNAVTKDHQTFDGAVFGSCGLVECLERARDRSGWRDKYGKLPPLHGIGVGIGAMAVGMKKKRPFDASAIFIKIAEDGIVTLFTGIPDMGQGSHTAMAMIAAEVLGIDTSDIRIVAGDTDITPFDLGAFAQRGTFVTGNAVIAACNDAKAQLAQLAGKSFGVPASGIEFSGRRVHVCGNPENGMDFRELVRSSLFSVEGRVIMGRGYYNTPVPQGPQGALLKVTVAHDIGRAINPLAVEGQIDGQVFSGMSQVLFEECIMKDGQVMNPSRLEYKLPRTYELPEIDYIIVETIDPYGPFGAKEVGEGPIVVSMGAIATAVSNAVGCIMPEMPMTPWAVLRALSQRSNEARSR